MLGAAWKALGAEEQAKWNAAAAKDKERYAAECEAAGVAPGGAKSKAEKGSAPAKAGAADKAREEELKAPDRVCQGGDAGRRPGQPR